MRFKPLILTLTCTCLLVSCASSNEGEDLASVISFAELTGSIDGGTYDFSYGPKGEWCYEKSREYIATVMGFDGSNGTSEMGEVQGAYRKACLNG